MFICITWSMKSAVLVTTVDLSRNRIPLFLVLLSLVRRQSWFSQLSLVVFVDLFVQIYHIIFSDTGVHWNNNTDLMRTPLEIVWLQILEFLWKAVYNYSLIFNHRDIPVGRVLYHSAIMLFLSTFLSNPFVFWHLHGGTGTNIDPYPPSHPANGRFRS